MQIVKKSFPDTTSLCYISRLKQWRAFLRRDGSVALSYAKTGAEALDDCARMLGVTHEFG